FRRVLFRSRPEAVADRCYTRPSPRFSRHFNPSIRLSDLLQRAHMASGTLLYSQSGGVTAVINATASGVIGEARARGIKVLAARNGILGALREELVDTSKETAATIRGLAHTPGGAFGSCRYKLKSVDADRAKYERLLEVFQAHDVRWFLYNGGNDSADTANKVSKL